MLGVARRANLANQTERFPKNVHQRAANPALGATPLRPTRFDVLLLPALRFIGAGRRCKGRELGGSHASRQPPV